MTTTLEALKAKLNDLEEVLHTAGVKALHVRAHAFCELRDAIAALQAEQGQEPVAHAWFHRGMVNFDEEESLRLLDKGKTIHLYAAPTPPAPQQESSNTIRNFRKVVDSGAPQPMTGAELVAMVHTQGMAGRVSLTFVDNMSIERPTDVLRRLVALLAAQEE